jgi:CHAT domain-containing protein/tetratricopeptide (TPR) repeat protein
MKKILILFCLIISINASSQKLSKVLKEISKDLDSENYNEALDKALKTNSSIKMNEDEMSSDYATLQLYLAQSYMYLGEVQLADSMYKIAIEDYLIVDNDYDPAYESCLRDYAYFMMDQKKYAEAETVLLEGLEETAGVKGENSAAYAYSLTTLGDLYYSENNYVEAEEKLKEAIAIFDKTSKREGVFYDYGYANELLASTYTCIEKYDLAIDLYKSSMDRYKKTDGENNRAYVGTMMELALIYEVVARYKEAEDLCLKGLAIEKSISGDRSEEYSDILESMASLAMEQGEYEKSEKLYFQTLAIKESGKFSANMTYFGLSTLYQAMADFASAEEMIFKALASDIVSTSDSSDYISDLGILANNYTLTGNYNKAEALYKQVASSSKIRAGAQSTEYAIDIDNLANLYIITDRDKLAEPLTLQAMEIKKKNMGEWSKDVAYSLNNLSRIYESLHDYQKAESYEKQAVEIYRKTLGEKNTDFCDAVESLAVIYKEEGKYNEAEEALKSMRDSFRKIVGENHPYYIHTIWNLADIYELTGRQDSAEAIYNKVNENLAGQVRKNFSYMSGKEKEEFIASINESFSDINSFIYRRRFKNPSITGKAYDNQLALKGIVLQSSKALRQAVNNSGDSALIVLYDSFSVTNKLLQQQEQLRADQRWLKCDSLENLSVVMEKDLNKKVKSLPGNYDISGLGNTFTWKDVQNSLGAKEAAIEFISFNVNDLKDTSDNILYCALILRPGMKQPEMIPMFNEDDMKSLMKRNRSSDDAVTADNLYRLPSNDQENNLYSMVWKPLEGFLTGVETIYYSPCGMLNIVSFDAIPCSKNMYLSDKYKLISVTSTREVINKYNEIFNSAGNPKTIFYGGINYDSDTTTMKSQNLRFAGRGNTRGNRYLTADSLRGGTFMYLDGTLREVQKIGSLLEEYKINKVTLTGDEATEESFKSLNNLSSPSCIHIATHGFFFPSVSAGSRQSNVYRSSDNPLFRTGLIFAGGNHAWKNQPLPRNVEDGILLASEVSEMYLPNTQLVVLSACETGLGEIKGTEGVFGLQRAFKMAGVNYLIISLWQVPDYQTSELMDKFYESWLSGKAIHDSFRQAQSFMKTKYRDNPSAWAAFTLIE